MNRNLLFALIFAMAIVSVRCQEDFEDSVEDQDIEEVEDDQSLNRERRSVVGGGGGGAYAAAKGAKGKY